MNHGFEGSSRTELARRVSAQDQKFISYFQLIFELCGDQALSGKTVLEVGSGRGGNLYFIKSYLGPSRLTGIDASSRNVEACRERFSKLGIDFLTGDAHELPVADGSQDFLVNVESSHYYSDRKKFFEEVHRVLKPGGRFLYTDLFEKSSDFDLTKNLLERGPLREVRYADITDGVARALKTNSQTFYEILLSASPTESSRTEAFNLAGLVYPQLHWRYLERVFTYHLWVLEKSP